MANVVQLCAAQSNCFNNGIVDGSFSEFLMEQKVCFAIKYRAFGKNIAFDVFSKVKVRVELVEIVRNTAKYGISEYFIFF